MRVADAGTAPPTIPFWMGEAPSRTQELSLAVGRLREEVPRRARRDRVARRECGLAPEGAGQLVAYVLEGAPRSGGAVADDGDRGAFFDESGGRQLVIHAPFGGRINRAWGLTLRKRFCVTFDFELRPRRRTTASCSRSASSTASRSKAFRLHPARHAAQDLAQAALASPMFTNRWRWNATRSLALLRYQSGKKVPMPLQRMRAEDLLAAVFPEQLGCQDNRGGGPIEIPDHPLVNETMDNCLTEAMDVDGLATVLDRIRDGDVQAKAIETVAPSPFSHEILNSNPYAYLDDAPLEGAVRARCRSARARRSWRAGSARSIPKRSPRSRGRRGPSRATPTSCTTRC
jgi:ATP-dependent Lhr-like helicase